MGRGLSDLQKDILRRAYRNRSTLPERIQAEFEEEQKKHADYLECCARVGLDTRFDQPPKPSDPLHRPHITAGETTAAHDAGNKRSTAAAVSRALARLVRR